MVDVKKLPQARMYWKIARYGVDELVSKMLIGYAFRLHLVAILASLRAVQHSLRNHDRTLSPQHKQVIDKWWNATPLSTPELHFIRTSRDLILKEGSFSAYATHHESSTGEGPNREITGEGYDLGYYTEDGKRHDLLADLRSAIEWCNRELTAIEAKVPEVIKPGLPVIQSDEPAQLRMERSVNSGSRALRGANDEED
jgi:hypothetical protein